jgi:glycosyltransferase involved in cell wall biosynthesis
MKPALSVVIPAYNEARFIGTLLERVLAVDLASLGLDQEIIVVNDGSTDRTAEVVKGYPVQLVDKPNGGKGSAVRRGIERATGQFLMIQDADLEYDPEDYLPMLRALQSPGVDAVYGSRYMGRPGDGPIARLLGRKHPSQSWMAYLGGRSLSLVALGTTGRYLTDTVTALKLFPTPLIQSLPLETTGFELDHEITARLIALRKRIVEVPISYHPRSKAEGKKIGLRDWFIGTRTFWRYRRG